MTALRSDCIETPIPENSCYVRFGPAPARGMTSGQIGTTVRGERVIADFDAEGRIIGLELIGGPAKPCQLTTADPAKVQNADLTRQGTPGSSPVRATAAAESG